MQISRDDALKMANIMINIAYVNIISNNISTGLPMHGELHSARHSNVPGIEGSPASLSLKEFHNFPHDSFLQQNHQKRARKQWRQAFMQLPAAPLQASSKQDGLSSLSARDNCQTATVLGYIMNVTVLQQHAQLIVKPPDAHVDIWDQMVAPEMRCLGMLVESWLHSRSRLSNSCCQDHCVLDSAGVRMGDRHWRVMQDHAKWAVCCDKAVVCFGDMNRVHSQRVRGGMALCMVGHSSYSLPGQLHAHLMPALRKPHPMCFWKSRKQCPCK